MPVYLMATLQLILSQSNYCANGHTTWKKWDTSKQNFKQILKCWMHHRTVIVTRL